MIEEEDILNSQILIVDDEPSNGTMLEIALKKEGFVNIQNTTSPFDAVKIYDETRPDLVLLDLRMPGMDGFEVLEAFWKIEKKYYPPVIILTAESDNLTRLKALKAGAKDFLSKPLNLPEVLCRCRNLLEMKLLHNNLVEKKDRMQQMVRERTAELWTANAMLREEIEEREEIQNRLEKQNELLQLVGQGASLSDCLDKVAGLWRSFSESHSCLHFIDESDGSMKVGHNWGLPEDFVRELDASSTPLEETPYGRSAASRQLVVELDIGEKANQTEFSQLLRKRGYASVWSVPILGREGALLGALELYFDKSRKPEKIDEAWVHLIAQLAGIVIERTRAEEKIKRINAQLLHSEKLSALGKLSASISHEFNNPIMGIRNVLEQVSREDKVDSGLQDLVDLAVRECSRVMKLATRLREFFKPSSGIAEPMDMKKAVEDMILLKKNELQSLGVEFDCQFGDELPWVTGVEDQIRQVILNLLQNAGESLAETGGRIRVNLTSQGSQLLFEVQDDGPGISPEYLDQIFEPFFTTKKDTVKGTGLGLSVSYGIVNKHGGHIECESSPGKGAKFKVYLPVQSNGLEVSKELAMNERLGR